jgi:proteasome lid subunit RPN8/RPN11
MFWMTPAADSQWRADLYHLKATTVRFDDGPDVYDTLSVKNVGRDVKTFSAWYYFATTEEVAPEMKSVLPVTQVGVGTQMRHSVTYHYHPSASRWPSSTDLPSPPRIAEVALTVAGMWLVIGRRSG